MQLRECKSSPSQAQIKDTQSGDEIQAPITVATKLLKHWKTDDGKHKSINDWYP